ncbi:unnamed protein product [Paramecium sonneborni]|uniref:Uncharacterized protein n=1 Tax=Paramecium sonneborni TaxID=65129 RepID=A0A8S1NWG7_9CILI|nr:unnamed protein product [Paramecium sonneborni]
MVFFLNYLDCFFEGNNGQFSSILMVYCCLEVIMYLDQEQKYKDQQFFHLIINQEQDRQLDNEHVYFIFDDYVQTDRQYWNTEIVKCGNDQYPEDYKEIVTNYNFTFNHNQKIQLPLQQLIQMSLRIQDFKVEIQSCSPGCQICNDDTPEECLYFQEIEINWFDNFNFDGWTLDQQQFNKIQSCLNVMLIGGINLFTGSRKLSKQFIILIPHYKIILQVQIWKVDFWNNNIFSIEIDEVIVYQSNIIGQAEVTQLCGDFNGEKLLNINLDSYHKLDRMLINMKFNMVIMNGSWGLRAFKLYLANCYQTCLECSGQKMNNCSTCKDGYMLHNFECQNGSQFSNNMLIQKISQFKMGRLFKIRIINHHFQNEVQQKLKEGIIYFQRIHQQTYTCNFLYTKKVWVQLEFWKILNWDNEFFQYFPIEFQLRKSNMEELEKQQIVAP